MLPGCRYALVLHPHTFIGGRASPYNGCHSEGHFGLTVFFSRIPIRLRIMDYTTTVGCKCKIEIELRQVDKTQAVQVTHCVGNVWFQKIFIPPRRKVFHFSPPPPWNFHSRGSLKTPYPPRNFQLFFFT